MDKLHLTVVLMEPKAKTPEHALRLRQGRKIKEFRGLKVIDGKLGATQSDVAAAINVTKAAVSDWERGISYPRPHHQIALAKYFGAPWSSLFGLDGENAA